MKRVKWLWFLLIIILLLILNCVAPLSTKNLLSQSPYGSRQYDLEEMKQKIASLKDPELHIGLAVEMSYSKKTQRDNSIEEIIKEYRKAIELDPQNILAHIGEVVAYNRIFISSYASDDNKVIEKRGKVTPQLLLAIDEGIKAEPQNAFYDYMRGWVYINEGVQLNKDNEFFIKDKGLVEKGSNEIVIGNQKEYCKDYYSERCKAVLKFREKLGMKPNFFDKFNVRHSTPPISLLMVQSSAEGLKALSKQYENENNQESAQTILKAISQMGRKIMQGSQNLISLMIGWGIMEEQGEEALRDYYIRRDMWKEAYNQERIIKKREDLFSECEQNNYKGQMGPLDTLFSNIATNIDPEPGLRVFYGILEEMMLIAFSILLIIICFLIFIASLDYKRRIKGYQLSPMTVSLQVKDIAIIYSGLIIPLLFYFINPFYNPDAILIQVLMVTLISLTVFAFLVDYRYRLIRKTILPSPGNSRVSLLLKLGMGLPCLVFLPIFIGYISFVFSNVIYRNYYQDIPWLIALLICYLYLAYLRTKEGAMKTSISRHFTVGRINTYILVAFSVLMIIYLAMHNAWARKWQDIYSFSIAMGVIILVIGYIINYFSWLTALRPTARPEGDLALVYQFNMLEAKSAITLYAGAAIILLLFNLTVVNPYLQRNARIYETTVIDKLIDDEVGMSKYKPIRDLKDF